MQMSDLERKIDARLAHALGHKLTEEENAYVKGVADGMIYARELRELNLECKKANLAKG